MKGQGHSDLQLNDIQIKNGMSQRSSYVTCGSNILLEYHRGRSKYRSQLGKSGSRTCVLITVNELCHFLYQCGSREHNCFTYRHLVKYKYNI